MKGIGKNTANGLILGAALLWSTCFIAMQICLDAGTPPTLINFGRGAVYLVLAGIFFHKSIRKMGKKELKIGLVVGIFSFFGYYLQSAGLEYTTLSNNAFLTATNVLMVPFLTWMVTKKTPKPRAFICVGTCLVGMAVLTGFLSGASAFGIGDVLTILCALCFAVQITVMGTYAKGIDAGVLVFMMALCMFLFGGGLFLINDLSKMTAPPDITSILCIVYLGVIGSFVSNWIQAYAQKYTSTTSAAILISAESVFTSILSVILGYEALSQNLIIGGSVILISIVLIEVNFHRPIAERV